MTQGVETGSTSTSILQEEAPVDEFFNVVATETVALFEYLEIDQAVSERLPTDRGGRDGQRPWSSIADSEYAPCRSSWDYSYMQAYHRTRHIQSL